MRNFNCASVLCAGVVFLTACSSAPPVKLDDANMANAKTVEKAPTQITPAKPVPTTSPNTAATALPPYLDPASQLSSKRSVYFDYDNFSVKPDYTSMLEMHGKYLAANPKLAIRVEGNADERGSREYNLALGQKRAEAVVRTLKVYGVRENQMEAVSWGEEKPKAQGHDEAAFSQNRRVDLAYPNK
jgi:peptidoglycan-associated lipoprotein